jgi:DNA-directed RNA polymerase subunit RPC12/RpoP
MDSLTSINTLEPVVSSPAAPTPLTCPDCGSRLILPENASLLTCPQCGEDILVGISDGQVCLSPLFPGLEGGIAAGDWRIPAMTIHQLKAEVKDLEEQLETLSRHGGLIDLIGKAGVSAIFAGFGYAVLNSATTLAVLPYGFVGLLSGMLLHGGSHLIGRDYYAQKAALLEKIHHKQTEIEHNLQQLSPLQP